MTIDDIVKRNKEKGGHFFDKPTLSFFNSTVFPDVFGDGYFITSEREDLDEPLRFKVRKSLPCGAIETPLDAPKHETFSEACEYAKLVSGAQSAYPREEKTQEKKEANIFSCTLDLLKAKDKRGATGNGFDRRHNDALLHPTPKEKMILSLIVAWVDYARTYLAEFETLIGKDSFIGPSWENIGKELHSNFLPMDMGRLDGGTLSVFMLDFAERNGGSLDGRER